MHGVASLVKLTGLQNIEQNTAKNQVEWAGKLTGKGLLYISCSSKSGVKQGKLETGVFRGARKE